MKNYTASNPNISLDNSKPDNVIKSDAKTQLVYLWIFSLTWNIFIFSFIFLGQDKLIKMVDESPLFYIFTLFPLVGLASIYTVIKGTIAWFTFGEAPLTLTSSPAKLGEKITGYIDINTQYDRTKQATVSLSCRRHYWKESCNKTEKMMDVIWQDDISVQTKASLNGSRLYFSFEPPSDLPETQKKSKDYHEWNINIELPLKGSDFEQKYIIPIAKADKDSIQESPKHVDKTVYNAPQHSFDSNSQTAKAIPQISKSLSGKSFHYPASRHRGLAIGFIIAGIVISFFLYFMQQKVAEVLPLSSLFFFSLTAIAPIIIFFFGVFVLGHTLTVNASLKGFEIKHRLLFYPHTCLLDASSIAEIKIEKSGSSNTNNQTTRVWYSIKAIQKDGTENTIGDSLEGHSHAELIHQQMIDTLGSRWKPSSVSESPKPSKIEKTKYIVRSSSKLVTLTGLALLAYDLHRIFGGE